MSWIQKLYEVYDAMAGVEDCSMVPVGFTQKKIKFNIILSAEGEFVTAQEIPEEGQQCMVPSTPQAEGRVGATGAPFPLADGLKYVIHGVGEENPRFEMYLAQLSGWCNMAGAPICLHTLLKYLQKRTLFQDLKSVPGLKLKYEPDGSGTDAKSFACFSVQTMEGDDRLWMREDVKQSWTQYFASLKDGEAGLCYATGRVLPISEKHPKFSGNAKLISAEDAGYPFLYKGRFVEDRSAVTVSSAVSARAHSALKWLMEHQGFTRYGVQIVGWNLAKPVLEQTIIEKYNPFVDDEGDDEQKRKPDTFEPYALALRDVAKEGEYEDFDRFSQEELTTEARKRKDEIIILGLQAATPGRMSVIYYQEMPGNQYVEHLENWEKQCRWEIPRKNGKTLSSPNWREISETIMGRDAVIAATMDFRCEKASTKQMREVQMRLLSCVTNGSKLPEDMVRRGFRRALSPTSFTDLEGKWNGFAWSQCVAVSCAMIRKLYLDKGEKTLSPVLNTEEKSRDYLFGRLLAVAHKLELDTMTDRSTREKNRTKTAAIQVMSAYVQNPEKSWMHLYIRLLPKLKKLGADGSSALYYQRLFGEIESLFEQEKRSNGKPLFYLFLVGFSAQLRELYCKAEDRQEAPELPPYRVPQSRDELFGCLLAVADDCQWGAEAEEKENHRVSRQDGATNAMRLTAAFAATPCATWGHIHDKLIPYLNKLDVKDAIRVQEHLRRIEQAFDLDDRLSDAPLGSGFLHGYLSMRRALIVKNGLDVESWKPISMPVLEIRDRDTAFGTLLAMENQVERWVLDASKDEEHNRPSNAMGFLQRAAQRPDEVVPYLKERMAPYAKKLSFPGKIREKWKEIEEMIKEKGWNTADPLQPGYLHTFYTYELINRKEN